MKIEKRRLELIPLTPLFSLERTIDELTMYALPWGHEGSAGSHLY